MKLEKYLNSCNVKSVDELTDKQIISYFEKGYNGYNFPIRIAMCYVRDGIIDKKTLINVLKKVLEDPEKRRFVCLQTEREGVRFIEDEVEPFYDYILGYIENGKRVIVETC